MFRHFLKQLMSHWELESDHSGSIYTTEISRRYRSGPFFPPESCLLNICQHTTGVGPKTPRNRLAPEGWCFCFPGVVCRGALWISSLCSIPPPAPLQAANRSRLPTSAESLMEPRLLHFPLTSPSRSLLLLYMTLLNSSCLEYQTRCTNLAVFRACKM